MPSKGFATFTTVLDRRKFTYFGEVMHIGAAEVFAKTLASRVMFAYRRGSDFWARCFDDTQLCIETKYHLFEHGKGELTAFKRRPSGVEQMLGQIFA